MLVRQSNVATRTCTYFVLPLITLAIPAGMLLVFLQRLPTEEIHLASTDARLLQPISTFWCAAQEITSSHPFYAYKAPKAPAVLKELTHLHTLSFRFNLLQGKHYWLRYHLLAGSTLELAGCTKLSSAPFDIFYGKEPWAQCLEDITSNKNHLDGSSEESDSDTTSEEGGNNIIPNKISKKGGKMQSCKNSIMSGRLEPSSGNEDHSPSCPPRRFPFALTVGRTGKYYILVRADGNTKPEGVLLHVRLNRTSYEMPENLLFCDSPSSCAVPLTFGAEERVVVFVSPEPDAGAVLFQVRSKCQPRAAFYLVVFLLLPVLFVLALLYVVRFQRRHRTLVTRNIVRERESLTRDIGAQETDHIELSECNRSDEERSKPPSYREVVRETIKTSPDSPPPSYEELLARPLVSVHRS